VTKRRDSHHIKIAREDHLCMKCGKLIRKGERFAMKLDLHTRSFRFFPTCLDCYESISEGKIK
jgi:hypothetical protein